MIKWEKYLIVLSLIIHRKKAVMGKSLNGKELGRNKNTVMFARTWRCEFNISYIQLKSL